MRLAGIFMICLVVAANCLDDIRVIQTTKAGDKLAEKPSLRFEADFDSESAITIDNSHKYQTILGFGGAFTEAAADNYAALSDDDKRKLMELYFTENGIGYSFGRVPMNSCDFSPASYSFDDTPNDYNLSRFDMTVKHDQRTMIPMIRDALKIADRDVKMFLSPWSPPAWMKTPVNKKQSMNGSDHRQGLLSEVQSAWAHYFVKFIQAYAKQGIEMWGLSVQNESEFAAPWEACVYSEEFQRDFIKNYLGPIVKGAYPDLKLMAYDHNRDHLFNWTRTMMSDPVTAKYVDGMAFHWYVSNPYANVYKSHEIAPHMFFLNTEGCSCPAEANSWDIAETYGIDYINDLNAWAAGWIDWNLLLDSRGGPNHLNNFCDAPMKRDLKTNALIIEPSYYVIGQVSKFVTPNSVRVKLVPEVTLPKTNTPANVNNGEVVMLYSCQGGPRGLWTKDFKLNGTDLCLDIKDNSKADGAEIQVWKCSGGANQAWTYDVKTQFIVSKSNQKCLTLDDAIIDGTYLQARSCEPNNKLQKWLVDGSYVRLAADPLKCLQASGPLFSSTAVETTDGHVVVVMMNALQDVPVEFKLKDLMGERAARVSVPPKGITTLVYAK